METKLLQQGAEAKIFLKGGLVVKDRTKKSYRIPEIDQKIRKFRTKSEIKLMLKASKIISVPTPLTEKKPKDDFKIVMPFINGKKLSEYLDKLPLKKQKQI